MLWTSSRDWGFWVAGYSAAQMAMAEYSGAPAVEFWSEDFVGICHALLQLADGSLVVATSEALGEGNGDESWFVVEDPNSLSGAIDLDVIARRIRVSDFTDWPSLSYGARTLVQLEDGSVVLGRGGSVMARLTLDQLYGVEPHADAAVTTTTSGAIGWDVALSSSGLLWFTEELSADVYGGLYAISASATEAGGSTAKVKAIDGDGYEGLTVGNEGGIWHSNAVTSQVEFISETQLEAATATPAPVTPDIVLTSPIFEDPSAFVGELARDIDGGLWVAVYGDPYGTEDGAPGYLVHFSSAQIAASGEETPDRVITLPFGWPAGAVLEASLRPPPYVPPSSFLAPYFFDAGTGATTEITPDIETNLTSGVAPLPVFFDAKGTTGTGVTLPYGELAYAWDFDDADGESWDRGAVQNGGEAFPKRLGLGPVECHVYETPGDYEAQLQVRDPNKKMASDAVAITVTDPETVFSGANTVLVSTGSDFTRDPGDYVGAAEVTTSTFAGIAAQCAAGKRVLLKYGDTWIDEGFLQVANVGPFHLGAWGDPLDGQPKLQLVVEDPVTTANIALGSDNRDDPLAGSTGGLRFSDIYLDGVGIEWFGATRNVLFLRVTMRNESAVCSGSVMNFFGHDIPDGVFFVDCDFQGVPTGSGNNIVFMAAKRQAYYGCRFSDSTEGEHCLRLSTAQRLVIAHCNIDGAPAGRHLLKLHAPDFDTQPNEGGGSPTPGVPNPNFPAGRYSEYANIHDNVFVNTEGCEWMVHPAPQNDATNERGRFYIFAGNLLQDPNGEAAVMLFMCDVLNSWVKGNAFDRGTGTAMHLGLGQRDSSEADLMGLHDCWIANNTHYGPSSTQAIINFRGPFGSGVSWENINEKNGLIVRGTVPTDAEFTSADNVITTTPELAVDPPVTTADYNLQSDSPAIGAGTGEGAAFWDLFLRPLDWGNGTTVDVGATQYEAP
jgi:hypothetical protein